jgi:hypothetical protein
VVHFSCRETMRRLPVVLLAASGAVAAALILFINRSGNFYYDEWDWFAGAAHLDAAKLFESDNGHLVLVPRLIYKMVLSAFGTHYLPFMLVNLALVLAISVLLFILARPRVGDWLALVPAVLLMFFGSGWDVLVTSVGINANLAVACGLGAFLALDRRTLAADLVAGGLVAIGLASQSGETAVALGGTVLLIGQGRWRRAWVMLVPLVLFGIWNAQAPKSGGGKLTVEHLGGLSHSLFDSVSSTIASVTGVFPIGFPSGLAEINVTAGRPLAAVAIVAAGAYLLLGGRRVTPRFLAYSTVVSVLWLSIGVVGRNPGTGRYNFVVLPFIFLAAFELLAGRPMRWRPLVALGAVLVLGLMANLNALRTGGAILRYHGASDRGVAAALELQAHRIEADPDLADESVAHLAATADPYSTDMVYVTAGDYLRAAREFGSAAYPAADIATAPEYAREGTDRVLLALLDPRLTPFAPNGVAWRTGCATLPDPASLVIPSGGLIIQASSASVEVRLRRFAEVSTSTPLTLPARSEGSLTLPGDELPQPWTAEVNSAAPVIACPRPGGAPIEASS